MKIFVELMTYQLYGDTIVGDQVCGQVNSTVCSFTKNVVQLVSFAKNSGYFAHHVDVLAIRVYVI